MANYSAIKAAVNAYIKANGKKEITGRILNSVLNATIDSLGRYFQFAGGALPTDDPGTPDQNVCYLAGEPGVYTNFGGITIENEEVALLFWNGEWTKQRILIGIQEVEVSVDNQVGTPSVDVSYSGGQLVLTFHNLKGETGDAAGFGTIGADINGGVGTPGVSVESSGDNTAKNLMFHFTNLKGETGVTSVVATIDDTSGTPSCQVSLVNGVLALAFSGLKGIKGDTGVSADYPITLYNGLDSDATDQALTAAQGKVLDGKISQLSQDVEEIYGTKVVADKFTFGGVSNVITFNPISIAEDGDALEFRVKTSIAASNANGYAFVRNGAGNIAISLNSAILGIKDATASWISDFNASSGKFNFVTGGAGAIDTTFRTFRLIRESTSLKLYIDGTLYKEVANAPTITFDRIGGAHSGNYWSGELEFFRYIHDGVTTELLDFPGYSATGDVTVTTHDVESGLLTEKVDKIPGKGLSTNDFTDEEKAELNVVANASALAMTDDFIGLLEDRALNDSGEELALPIVGGSGYGKFIGVSGKIYTGAANLVRLLLVPGSVTYNGVTLTIDEDGWVTMTGTASATGYICYNNLKGYSSIDTAKTEVVIPEMPSGNYSLGITQKGTSSKATIYVRSKSTSSFLALLTISIPTATIGMMDVGAMGAYLISGETYNEHFRFMLMPSVFRSAITAQAYNDNDFPVEVELIDKDGIYVANYTMGDGSVTKIEKLLPSLPYATKGVNCLWFGDSISELQNLPHLVGEKLAVNVIDVSEAGSPFTKTGLSKWYDTGVESLIEQKIADDFSIAETALSEQLADGDITQDRYAAKMANLESLENCDMSSIKKIVILAGTNDLTSASLTIADFKNGIGNTLADIFTEYPDIQVYCITPPYRMDADDVRPNGLVLSDIVGAIVDVCKSFGVPCFDFLANCGVNSVNASHWLQDGLHPSADGDEMFSTRIANWLKSIF